MKIINVSNDDFSNFAFSNSEALKSVGVDCHSFKLQDHPFKYPKQSDIVSVERMIEEIKKADVVQFFHDNISLFNLILPYCKDKKLIGYHTTSLYRKEHERLNTQMNPHIYRAVNCMPEFMDKGAKNEVYMVGAVDTKFLSNFKRKPKRPYIIGHYPSNPVVKGTVTVRGTILNAVGSGNGVELMYSEKQVGYVEQLNRISDCDIYVEMLTDVDGLGSSYGNFGITALEASAMGKYVLTQCNDWEVYSNTYGWDFPFFHIRHRNDLFSECRNFIYADLKKDRHDMSNILERKHGYKASGEYILKNIL